MESTGQVKEKNSTAYSSLICQPAEQAQSLGSKANLLAFESPNWPGARAGARNFMICWQRIAWVRFAMLPKSRMPRYCLTVLGWRHLGIMAIGPPLQSSGSVCQMNSFKSKSWYKYASPAASLWKRADGKGSSPVAFPALVMRNASSSWITEGKSVRLTVDGAPNRLRDWRVKHRTARSWKVVSIPASNSPKWEIHWSSSPSIRKGGVVILLCWNLGSDLRTTVQNCFACVGDKYSAASCKSAP